MSDPKQSATSTRTWPGVADIDKPVLESAHNSAVYWLNGAREYENKDEALIAAEQAVNLWKNAAVHFAQLANKVSTVSETGCRDTAAKDEEVWLIEAKGEPGRPLYATCQDRDNWTDDAFKAARFPSSLAAEVVKTVMGMHSAKAVAHLLIRSPTRETGITKPRGVDGEVHGPNWQARCEWLLRHLEEPELFRIVPKAADGDGVFTLERIAEVIDEDLYGPSDTISATLEKNNAAPQVPPGVCPADDPNPEAKGIGEPSVAAQRPGARGVAPSVSDDRAGTGTPAVAAPVTDAMVDRFLSWKLPEDFHPDAGISFSPYFNVEYNAKQGKPPQRHEPIGTNLLMATQARAMLEHVLADTPSATGMWIEAEKAKADAYEAAARICEEMSYPPEGRDRWATKEEEWAAIKLEDAAKAIRERKAKACHVTQART